MRRIFEDLADGICVGIDPVNSGNEVSTIPLQEYGVFGPVVVFVSLCKRVTQLLVIFATWVENATEWFVSILYVDWIGNLPATHDVTVTTKDLCQAAYHDI